MKYTAEQIRNERISIECDNREQALKLQAHFHKLYPNDGYMKSDVGSDKQFLRLYKVLNNCFGWMHVSFLYTEGYCSDKEIHFNDFDFEDKIPKEAIINGTFYSVQSTRETPKHYDNSKGYDVIDFCNDYKLNFNRGSACKYIARSGKKDNEIEDLQKAIDFLQREIQYLQTENAPQ